MNILDSNPFSLELSRDSAIKALLSVMKNFNRDFTIDGTVHVVTPNYESDTDHIIDHVEKMYSEINSQIIEEAENINQELMRLEETAVNVNNEMIEDGRMREAENMFKPHFVLTSNAEFVRRVIGKEDKEAE